MVLFLFLFLAMLIVLSVIYFKKTTSEGFVADLDDEIEDVELEKKEADLYIIKDDNNKSEIKDEKPDDDTLILIDERRKQGELFSNAIDKITEKINDSNTDKYNTNEPIPVFGSNPIGSYVNLENNNDNENKNNILEKQSDLISNSNPNIDNNNECM